MVSCPFCKVQTASLTLLEQTCRRAGLGANLTVNLHEPAVVPKDYGYKLSYRRAGDECSYRGSTLGWRISSRIVLWFRSENPTPHKPDIPVPDTAMRLGGVTLTRSDCQR